MTIKQQINELAENWHSFQEVNDLRLNDIASATDPLINEKLSRINNAIENCQSNINKLLIQKSVASPRIEYSDMQYDGYKKAFCNYVRKGFETPELNKGCNIENINSKDVGYSVTTKMQEYIHSAIQTISPMRSLANIIEISTDSLEILDSHDDIQTGWSESILTTLDQQNPLNLTKKTIAVNEIYAQPKATQKLIDDPQIDIEKWLSDKLVEAFATQENIAFIKGDGIGKPYGLLSGANNDNTIIGDINDEYLIKLFYSLSEKYSSNGKFLVSRDAMQKIRMMKESTTGRYIYQPDFSGKGSNTLLGAEIITSNDMPSVMKNEYPIVFGDFKKAYQIIDRQDIRILRDPFTHKPFIKFYATKRVGGDVVNSNAIKFLKIA